MKTDIIYNEDCLTGLSKIPDKSIDLIVIDPPYNIKKDKWDDIKNYEEWMKKVILELQRVLKDNGSFYMFHSEMEVVSDFMRFFRDETNFIFRQFIVWNKRFEGSPKKGFLDGFVEVTDLRNYQQMAEYILFYTFQGEWTNNQVYCNLQKYFREEQTKCIKDEINIDSLIPRTTNFHYFANGKSFGMPTEENYKILQKTGYFNKSFKELKQMFQTVRITFNNQKTHHSVWNYDIENKIGHTTPKPLELIKNIILHSSKEGQIVLDCFMGSGTTALACKELNRRFIGFEKDPKYCKLISKRLSQQNLNNLSEIPKPTSHIKENKKLKWTK